MLSYNPKDWFSFLFYYGRSDTVRKLLPLLIVMALYSWLIAYLEIEVWQLSDKSYVRNTSIMHTMLGFVISFLLVFRTNTAYERWWEGRKLWGSLVNNSRNLAMKIASLLPPDHHHRVFFRKAIPAYAVALKNHLRSEETAIALFDGLDAELQHSLDMKKHVPNQVASLMFRHVQDMHRTGTITGEQLLFINNELMAFTDICGACERIKNTPIPYSYSVFIKKFIFVYVITLPFGFVFNLGYYVIPIVTFIFYVLTSLELIAEEIEEPFGGDENDLPLEKMAHNIRVHIHEII